MPAASCQQSLIRPASPSASKRADTSSLSIRVMLLCSHRNPCCAVCMRLVEEIGWVIRQSEMEKWIRWAWALLWILIAMIVSIARQHILFRKYLNFLDSRLDPGWKSQYYNFSPTPKYSPSNLSLEPQYFLHVGRSSCTVSIECDCSRSGMAAIMCPHSRSTILYKACPRRKTVAWRLVDNTCACRLPTIVISWTDNWLDCLLKIFTIGLGTALIIGQTPSFLSGVC